MSKTLVAFFSASGTTAHLAQRLASVIAAEVHEIVPEVPYAPADLNWRDKRSRSSREMGDKSTRPALAPSNLNLSAYDTVLLGFPIWWYREPSVIDSFLEAHDFTGKTIVPFATSGGSGMGSTAARMRSLAPGATVLEGRRLSSRESDAKLRRWFEGLGV